MKAKNLFALLLCLAMVFALTACGQGTPSASPAPAQATPEPEETTLPSADGKSRKTVLKNLLKSKELDNTKIY